MKYNCSIFVINFQKTKLVSSSLSIIMKKSFQQLYNLFGVFESNTGKNRVAECRNSFLLLFSPCLCYTEIGKLYYIWQPNRAETIN